MAAACLSSNHVRGRPGGFRIAKRCSTACQCTPRQSCPSVRRRRDVGAALLLALCWLLAGCAVGPTFTTPQATVTAEAGARRATRASRPRPRPTACGGRRSMIRRSIAWSSSPTGRTCRCRSPACGSWRRAPSSASPPAGSFPRRRWLFGQRRARSGSAEQRSPTSATPTATSSTISWASTPPGSWTSGASTGAAWKRKPPACSRRWPTTTPPSSRSPRRSRAPTP